MPGRRDTWEGWEDSAVPPDRLGEYLRGLRRLFDQYGYEGPLYGHFGDGCVHNRITFDMSTPQGIATWRRFLEEAADLVVSMGGSLSGEHGDGQARAELLEKMFDAQLIEAFREFKSIWDPPGRMNPGKKVDPYPIVTNLREGPGHQPREPWTHFRYPNDQGRFSRAVSRCVGVGLCRRSEGGLMCPSFMVTRDEEHTTRGRAHLLFEMLQGDAVTNGWRSKDVRNALDLCLSCKGCRTDCPVNVDMATYKAEFLSHHYRGRLKPRAAYSMGQVMRWARLGSHVPRIANAFTHAPGLTRLTKWVAGIAPQREVPHLARPTFRHWFQARAPVSADGAKVLLWPDTFHNYFEPRVAQDAVAVLERLGLRVRIPKQVLCCGRPLYDYGLLRKAKRRLRTIVGALADDIRAGTPLIGLEPSCVAVFRDELVNLFPHEPAAVQLSKQTRTLAEFLQDAKLLERLPKAPGPAIVQRHCHHRSVMGFSADEQVLRAIGVDADLLDAGCCGLAGSFGFERRHYETSMKIGERALLPRIRSQAETRILADGFSCRTQILHGTGRPSDHLATVLRRAFDGQAQPVPRTSRS